VGSELHVVATRSMNPNKKEQMWSKFAFQAY